MYPRGNPVARVAPGPRRSPAVAPPQPRRSPAAVVVNEECACRLSPRRHRARRGRVKEDYPRIRIREL